MKKDLSTNDLNAVYTVSAWLGIVALALIVSVSLYLSAQSSDRYYRDLLAKGYIECPQMGTSVTTWVPADSCPALKSGVGR